MGKISNNELAAVLIDRKQLSKKNASRFVNELFNVIRQGLMNERLVKVKGLGTFKIIDVDDRESVNVNTGERVLIGGHSKISFTPDTLMKELVNKPFSQFETVVLKDGVVFEDVSQSDEIEEPIVEEEPIAGPEPEPMVEPDSLSEQEIESLSEPVVELEVADETDASMAPLVEFVTDNEPQISSEPEPEPEPEPAPEPTPEPVEDSLPMEESSVAETEATKAETEGPITEEEVPEYDIEAPESSGRWKMWLLGILACLVCFAGGYYVGMTYGHPSSPTESQADATKLKIEASKPAPVKPEAVKPEIVKETPELSPEPAPAAEAKPEVKPEPKPEPKPEAKPEPKTEPKPVTQSEPTAALDKYEQMDSRVRTGAYRIVGTDHVEKIKPGDNLARICKRTIGPDMECYLEVYNGIKGDTDLKVGQEIKIPKLEHKKKKVKKDN